MAEEKARVGFSLDLKDTKTQLDGIIKGLKEVKTGFQKTGKDGEASVNKLNLGLRGVFKNISAMSTNLRKSLAEGSRLSRRQLNELINKSKSLESRLSAAHAKTAKKYEDAEGRKKKALQATVKAQEKAIKDVSKLSKTAVKSVKDIEKAFLVLESIATVKLASTFRSLVKEATILAARNQVLGTAMRTVGNNAGITTDELGRTETTVRKLGISINDTRELISRFSQAQLGMVNATRLARSAQDLAAGSTLGSSEALRIMTQSILSLLPRQLRQFGVVVNLNQVYKEQSLILGKSVNDLTSLEKRQGLLNKIFEEAAKRAGAYERSMKDAGKVMTTLSSRIIPDTLSMFGDELLPVFSKLVFAVKDVLEGLQQLGPAWKTLISALALGVTVILSLKAALILLGGTLGFVKAGFTGAAVSASAASAAMGPLIIAIGALAAALIVIPKLFDDATTSQEKFVKATQDALDNEVRRLTSLEDLQKVLENQALKEEDVGKIIRANAGRIKELIPLLNKEKATREDVVEIINKLVKAQQELVQEKLKERKVAAEANKERLKDEQFVLGELIKMENQFKQIAASMSRHFVPGVIQKSLDKFKDSLTDQQKAMKNFGKFMELGLSRNFKELNNELKRTDAELKEVSLGLDKNFGLAAKGVVKNASDMNQAFLTLDKRLDKLVAKTAKKFPFKALIEEQEAFAKDLDKAVLEDSRRDELLLKSQTVFQQRFAAAEIKFREKLESIGATDLQKIEAKRKKEIEINQGGAVAIQAIEKEAAFARNAVFTKMWDERLAITQGSIDALINIVRTERDLVIQGAQRDAAMRIAEEKLGADEIVQIRIDLRDRTLQIIKTSQDEEFALRKQHFEAVATQLAMLYGKGIINQQQFNERSKVLATDLKNFRQGQLDERIANVKSSLDQMVSAEQSAAEKIKAIEEEKANALRSTEATIRQLRQQGQTSIQNFNEDRKRAEDLLSEGQTAIRENDFDRVKEINSEIKSIALATSKEVRENSKKDSQVLISADKARIGSIKLVDEAGALLQKSFEAQRSAEESAVSKLQDKLAALEGDLKALTEEKRQIEIELVGEAAKQIADIQKRLDNLKDKTITVTVMTKGIAVSGAGTGVGGEGAATGGPIPDVGDNEFAEGAVDIQGPGTAVSDSIVSMLSRGESVVTAAATQMFKPLLELMNTDPEKLRQVLSAKISAGAVGGGDSISNNNSTQFGDIAVNINGVAPADVRNINWRETVRKDILPEIAKVKQRKSLG